MKIIKSKCKKFKIIIDKNDYNRVNEFAVNGWEIKYTTGSNNPYVLTRKTIDGKRKQYYLHIVVMNTLDDPTKHIDHINRNTLDNRKSNLRFVTRRENMKNRTSKKNSRCKYLGVSYCESKRGTKKYRTNIKDENISKNNIHLGYYYDEDSAGYAYNLAAKTIHHEFANLNDINMSNISNKKEIESYISEKIVNLFS